MALSVVERGASGAPLFADRGVATGGGPPFASSTTVVVAERFSLTMGVGELVFLGMVLLASTALPTSAGEPAGVSDFPS